MNDTGKALCISEPGLCSLLGNKINLDAWDMWDAYTELAANSILNTIYNLVQHKYLQISSSEHSYKLLPVTIFRKTEFHLQLIQYPHISSTTGYFKQILLQQLTKNEKLHFGKTIEYALRNIFPQQKVKHAGKYFFYQILQNQRLNLFTYTVTPTFRGSKLLINRNPEKELLWDFLLPDVLRDENNNRIAALKRIITHQLNKFKEGGLSLSLIMPDYDSQNHSMACIYSNLNFSTKSLK